MERNQDVSKTPGSIVYTSAQVYRFEVTWSDESKTTKELSSDDLNLFRVIK